MSLNEDQEILEDFLTEAGEILEALSEDLVDFESQPDDQNLLNTIFRGFHTLKGSASFLGFDVMVDLSHKTEDVIDAIRSENLYPRGDVMDVILQSLDNLQNMRECLLQGKELPANDPELMDDLQQLSKQPRTTKPKHTTPDPALAATLDRLNEFRATLEDSTEKSDSESENDTFDDNDFEALLDELHGAGVAPGNKAKVNEVVAESSEAPETDIDIDELLDEYYGVGQIPGQPLMTDNSEQQSVAKKVSSEMVQQSRPDLQTMDDREFEDLLNQVVTEQIQVKQRKHAAEAKFLQRRPTSQTQRQSEQKTAGAPLLGQDQSIRVEVKRLDEIITMVGELVLVRNRLATVSESYQDEALNSTSENLDTVTRELQSATLKTRLQTVRRIFSRFPRLIRELARSMEKNVSLTLEGEETEIDKYVVEAMSEPLIHLVRNALDHGIERPDIRAELGKTERGEITLGARLEGEFFVLSVTDDGRGMHTKRIKEIAIQKGIVNAEDTKDMSRQDILQLIFRPGFSTHNEVTHVSGRGVGLDVVQAKVNELHGSIQVHSTPYEGTKIELKLPLSLAIFSALMVKVEQQIYAIPIAQVKEVVKVATDQIGTNANKQLVFKHNSNEIPMISLHDWQNEQIHHSVIQSEAYAIIYDLHDKSVALLIDRVLTQEDVVIKALGQAVGHTFGITGATLTAEGSIALVLDVPELVSHHSGLD